MCLTKYNCIQIINRKCKYLFCQDICIILMICLYFIEKKCNALLIQYICRSI